MLLARARQLLEPSGPEVLELGVEPVPFVAPLVSSPPAQPELFTA